ncbi:DUF7107 domain-containing protein [Nannocystis pusilla]|uniref:DUF7107 domain-containing protein n=1 Tax=Nannocystis pusilla TaxID=889268 RepID=UPI003B7F377D
MRRPPPPECKWDSDCYGDQICVDYECVDPRPRPCNWDSDCYDGQFCVDYVCVDPRPPASGTPIATAARSASTTPASILRPLQVGLRLLRRPDLRRLRLRRSSAPCKWDSECYGDQICVDYVCVDPPTSCKWDSECYGGQICVDYVCVDPPPPASGTPTARITTSASITSARRRCAEATPGITTRSAADDRPPTSPRFGAPTRRRRPGAGHGDMRARPRSFAPFSAELLGRRWTYAPDGDSSDSPRAVVIDPPGGPSTASTSRGSPAPPTSLSGATTRGSPSQSTPAATKTSTTQSSRPPSTSP